MRYLCRMLGLTLVATFGPTLVHAGELPRPMLAKLVFPKAEKATPPKATPKKKQNTETWVRMHPATVVQAQGGYAVVLKDEADRYFLPIWIGISEARSIQAALQNQIISRPLTHDLLRTVIDNLGASVIELRIHKLQNDIFYGRLLLETAHGNRKDLDTRPSDGIALAARTGAPIYVATDVIRDAAVPFSPQK